MIDIRRNIGYSNCYVVNFNNEDDESISIIIDPSVPYRYLKKDIKGKLKAIILTHGHYDHFSELESCLENNKDVPIYLHKNALNKLNDPYGNCSQMFGVNYTIDKNKYNFIYTNDKIELEYSNGKKEELLVFNTPGHTNCSITIMYENYLFTGDFLFNNSIGRTDLYSGNPVEMKKSLEWIKGLMKYDSKDNYFIYPGHEEETNLIDELKYNYYLR